MTDDDPFDALDPADGREGDPFERLADEAPDDGPDATDGADGAGGDETAGGDRETDPAAGPESDPFDGFDAPEGDPFEANAGVFEAACVDEVNPDAVWERLTAEGAAAGDEDVVEVSKHAYCEGCEHFSAPPDVACTHPGTEILEFVDVETVRVADCPVVAERRRLGHMED